MGLLDSVIGGVLGQVLGGRGSSTMSPIVKALLMLLLAKGMSGGFGDIFGRGAPTPHPAPEPGRRPAPPQQDDATGDIGGFGQHGGGGGRISRDDGDYGDLAGMLDGPGGAPEAASPAGAGHEGGFDGLLDSFRRSGLGDVIGSWVGHGNNAAIAPERLADALGPDTVDTLQRQTGLDRSALLAQLAEALPEVIDRLTPQGRLPTQEERRHW